MRNGSIPVAGSLGLCPLPTLGRSTTSWRAAGAGLDLTSVTFYCHKCIFKNYPTKIKLKLETSLTASGRLFRPPEFLGMLFLVRWVLLLLGLSSTLLNWRTNCQSEAKTWVTYNLSQDHSKACIIVTWPVSRPSEACIKIMWLIHCDDVCWLMPLAICNQITLIRSNLLR